MNLRRLAYGLVLVAILGMARPYAGYTQESPAIGHATRVLDLLEAGKFEEVAAEFNAKMVAALPVSRLRDVWTTVSRQAGARTSIIRQRVVTQATGIVTVVNVCQFEKAALTVMLSFDPENKIAGMNITPSTPPAAPNAAPASTRFTEEPIADVLHLLQRSWTSSTIRSGQSAFEYQGYLFYQRLNHFLDQHGFDDFV